MNKVSDGWVKDNSRSRKGDDANYFFSSSNAIHPIMQPLVILVQILGLWGLTLKNLRQIY